LAASENSQIQMKHLIRAAILSYLKNHSYLDSFWECVAHHPTYPARKRQRDPHSCSCRRNKTNASRISRARNPQSKRRIETSPRLSTHPIGRDASKDLVDLQALDIECQLGIGGNVGNALFPVGQLRRDDDPALAASADALKTDFPALDDLASAKLERERLALFVR
jgi:hypothetical protein